MSNCTCGCKPSVKLTRDGYLVECDHCGNRSTFERFELDAVDVWNHEVGEYHKERRNRRFDLSHFLAA